MRSCGASHEQCLAGLGDLTHQERRRLQVPIRVGHVRHDVAGDRIAIVAALLQQADGEGVAQIVDARVTARVRASQFCAIA